MSGRGRPRKLGEHTPVLLRVPDDLLREIEEWRQETEERMPSGATFTRADMMRRILEDAVRRHRRRRAG